MRQRREAEDTYDSDKTVMALITAMAVAPTIAAGQGSGRRVGSRRYQEHDAHGHELTATTDAAVTRS